MTDLENMAYQKLFSLITNALSSDRETDDFYLEGNRILVEVTVGTGHVEYVIPMSINLNLEPVETGGGVHLQ